MITIKNEFEIGEQVFDDLTRTKIKIIGISFSRGFCDGNKLLDAVDTIGYWVDNDYLCGGRHPWELTKIRE